MRPSRKIAVVGALVLLLLFFAWCLFLLTARPLELVDGPPSSLVALEFVTFTNSSAGPKLALFRIRNFAHRPILFFPGTAQVQSQGFSYQLDAGTKVSLLLKAGETTAFSVARPASGSVWRGMVFWHIKPTKLGILKAFLFENQAALRKGRSLPGWNFGMGVWHTELTPDVQ